MRSKNFPNGQLNPGVIGIQEEELGDNTVCNMNPDWHKVQKFVEVHVEHSVGQGKHY